jgi:enoyl-CoA hydratase/carnithine racemase
MIDIVEHGPIRELRLARPPANALELRMVAALREALRDAVASGREAIVLSGRPGRFSGGLDVPALLALDRVGIHELWRTFFALLREIAELPVPVVAALTGHSPAGGTVLALFADRRVLAEGDFVVGLNEVRVGLPVPDVLMRALAFLVGQRQAARLAIEGLLLSPEQALQVGLVDEVVPVDDVVPRALAWTRELLTLPRASMLGTRALARQPLAAAFESVDEPMLTAVTDHWFSDETQRTLRALVGRLKRA